MASINEDSGTISSAPIEAHLNWDAVAKYVTAIVVQMSLGFGIFTALDRIVKMYSFQTPFAVNVVFFYFMALKSRVLNPLANNRPQPKTLETRGGSGGSGDDATVPNTKRIMPSWTPPGFIFPIVWLLVIGPIRAITSSLIYTSTGRYACWPIMSLLLHLSIGDVWNTINNVERRYGVSFEVVTLVWLSKAHAAYQFTRVNAVAGRVLAATLVWLTIASALVFTTWRINPDPSTGKPEPLYPVRGKVPTKFAWFSAASQ